jgi:serralysin
MTVHGILSGGWRGDPGASLPGDPGPEYFMPPTSGVAANGLPIYSWTQAAAQITRPNANWSTLGSPATVSYAFRSTEPGTMPDGTGGFSRFTSAQITAAELALRLWSDVANITFVRVGSGTAGEGAYSDSATMLFANYATGADNASAFAYYPGSTAPSAVQGDIWVNSTLASNGIFTEGSFGPQTLAHEIGHAIGLAHPANYDASDGAPPAYETNAVYWQDARMFTIMSYFGSANTGGSLNGFASGPQMHDIAAAQRLYGANMTTRTGDTIYGFNSNTGLEHFSIPAGGRGLSEGPVFCIWDAGGNDTLDLSGYNSSSEIDLRPESFSNAGLGNGGTGVAVGNISIARGAVIENAIGGGGADTLIGNDVANMLDGRGGADTMTGGLGGDLYFVDNSGDVANELAGQGTDTIYTTITYTLPSNIEALAGLGALAINLFGNTLANTIVGNSAQNTMDGGVGADTLIGGFGDDLYVIDDQLDVIIESAGEGALDTIYTSFSFYQMGANVENTQVTGGSGSYIVGNSVNNLLVGNSGADTLEGAGGADTLVGAAGDDFYIIADQNDVIIENAGAGNDTIYTSISFYQMGANVENLSMTGAGGSYAVGNDLDNLIVGNSGADTLDGGAGGDFMVGHQGDDIYFVDNLGDRTVESASEGTDAIYTTISWTIGADVENLVLQGSGNLNGGGNALANFIFGNSGANIITGGAGNDILSGGAGADSFVYSIPSQGSDSVTDFVSGADRISVSAAGFGGGLVSGGAAPFSSGSTPSAVGASFLYDTDDGRLFWDSDGAGGAAAILIATLSGAPVLTASDIIIGP